MVDHDKRFADDYLFFRFTEDERLVESGQPPSNARDFIALAGHDSCVPASLVVPEPDEKRLKGFLKVDCDIGEPMRVVIVGA